MSHASVANYYCICMYMCYQIQNPVCRINLYQLTIFQVCIRCRSQMFFSDFQSGILMNFRFFNLSRFAGFLGWKFSVIIGNRNIEHDDMAIEFLPQSYCKIQRPQRILGTIYRNHNFL